MAVSGWLPVPEACTLANRVSIETGDGWAEVVRRQSYRSVLRLKENAGAGPDWRPGSTAVGRRLEETVQITRAQHLVKPLGNVFHQPAVRSPVHPNCQGPLCQHP